MKEFETRPLTSTPSHLRADIITPLDRINAILISQKWASRNDEKT